MKKSVKILPQLHAVRSFFSDIMPHKFQAKWNMAQHCSIITNSVMVKIICLQSNTVQADNKSCRKHKPFERQ